jgi:hypothetical protein
MIQWTAMRISGPILITMSNRNCKKKLNMCFSNISSYDCFWHNTSVESKTCVTNSQKLGSGEVSQRLQRPDQISNKTNSNENSCQLILITMSNRNCTWKLFVWTHVICSSFLHNIRVWLKCGTNSQKLGSGKVSQRLQRPDQISKKTNSNENFCQLIGLITMRKQKLHLKVMCLNSCYMLDSDIILVFDWSGTQIHRS